MSVMHHANQVTAAQALADYVANVRSKTGGLDADELAAVTASWQAGVRYDLCSTLIATDRQMWAIFARPV